MIQPTSNDVLSGRGASFNRHEGNEQFRKLLAQQRVVYSKSDKMRKVAISKSIVETVYSLNPPGRFLRKNAASDQWEELSKKEALNKVAQAMAYAVRDLLKTEKGDAKQRSRSHPSPQIISTTPMSIAAIGGNDAESQQGRIISLDGESHAHRPGNQLEQLLLLSQQFGATNQPTPQISTQSHPPLTSLNRFPQFLNQLQTQQIYQQQQQDLLRKLQMQQLTSHLFPSTSNNLYSTQNSLLFPSNDALRLASFSLLDGRQALGPLQHTSTLSMRPIFYNDQTSLNSMRVISPSSQQLSDTVDVEILPRNRRPNQPQRRLDMPMYQNQLLASSARNQWYLQQPLWPLDLVLSRQLQMVRSGNSCDLTELHHLVSQTTNLTSTLPSSSAAMSSSLPAARPSSTASLFEGRKEGCDDNEEED